MAELLIKAIDHRHKDPAIDRAGAYKRGDPVIARPDGHPWGRLERLPKFWRVRVLNAPQFLMQQFCESEYEVGLWLPGKPLRTLTRRLHSFRPEMLPLLERRALLWGEIVEMSFEMFVKCSVKKGQARIILAA